MTKKSMCDFAVLSAAGDARIFNEIYEIYVAAIPPSERKSRDDLMRMSQQEDYTFHVAKEDDSVLAFGIVYGTRTQGISLLEYFATSPTFRNRGIGGGLLDDIFATHTGHPILIEVEAPPLAAAAESQEMRRINFYRRHGAKMVDGFSYVLPLKTDGTPPPMAIMIGAAEDLTSIPSETLRRWLGDIYENVYGVDRKCPAFLSMFTEPGAVFVLR